jgi:hypothetical protein
VSVLGDSLVAHSPGEGHSHIMLMRAPSTVEVDQQDIERQVQGLFQDKEMDRRVRDRSIRLAHILIVEPGKEGDELIARWKRTTGVGQKRLEISEPVAVTGRNVLCCGERKEACRLRLPQN